jgi:hypothetical protein
MQVYEDMKSELAIMTKPKDPNVLVVYGVYVIRPADPWGGLGEGMRGARPRALLAVNLAPSQGGDAVGAAARHGSVGPLGTKPPRRPEAPNQGRVICAAA